METNSGFVFPLLFLHGTVSPMSTSIAWFWEQLYQNQRFLLKMLLSDKACHRPIILESLAWDPKFSILKAHAIFAVQIWDSAVWLVILLSYSLKLFCYKYIIIPNHFKSFSCSVEKIIKSMICCSWVYLSSHYRERKKWNLMVVSLGKKCSFGTFPVNSIVRESAMTVEQTDIYLR